MATPDRIADARERVRNAADHIAAVTTNVLLVEVPPADFPLWVEVLDSAFFYPRLRDDGTVAAHVTGYYRDCHVSVHTSAYLLRGVELPPVGSEDAKYHPVPADQVWRLESVTTSQAVAS